MSLLTLDRLNVTYRGSGSAVHAVRDVSLTLNKETTYGVVGESGSGKSTLAHAILRLLPPSTEVTGQIFFGDTELLKLSEEAFNRLRWQKLAVVFQGAMNNFSPVHLIGEQLSDIYRVHRPHTPKHEIRDHILDLLRRVNLREDVYKAYPHELSGGMMQRVSIAAALMFHPELLILDEATTALDVVTERKILDEIMALEQEEKLSRLTITHDISVVATSCERMIVMYGGFIVEEGSVERLLQAPRHPYTQGLIRSFPSLETRKEEIAGIPGTLPDLSQPIPGCPFAPRCPYAAEICRTERPVMTATDDGRVMCHFPLEVNG